MKNLSKEEKEEFEKLKAGFKKLKTEFKIKGAKPSLYDKINNDFVKNCIENKQQLDFLLGLNILNNWMTDKISFTQSPTENKYDKLN